MWSVPGKWSGPEMNEAAARNEGIPRRHTWLSEVFRLLVPTMNCVGSNGGPVTRHLSQSIIPSTSLPHLSTCTDAKAVVQLLVVNCRLLTH